MTEEQRQNEELHSQIRLLRTSIAQLQQQRTALERRKDRQSDVTQQLLSDRDGLCHSLEEARELSATKEEKINRLSDENADLVQNRRVFQQEIETLRSPLGVSTTRNNDLEDQLELLRAQSPNPVRQETPFNVTDERMQIRSNTQNTRATRSRVCSTDPDLPLVRSTSSCQPIDPANDSHQDAQEGPLPMDLSQTPSAMWPRELPHSRPIVSTPDPDSDSLFRRSASEDLGSVPTQKRRGFDLLDIAEVRTDVYPVGVPIALQARILSQIRRWDDVTQKWDRTVPDLYCLKCRVGKKATIWNEVNGEPDRYHACRFYRSRDRVCTVMEIDGSLKVLPP